MKSTVFLIGMVILAVFLTISNLFYILTAPIHTAINIVAIAGLVTLSIMYGRAKRKETYDYNQENPNALVTGYNVSGTVYASDPYATPGLGWVV